MSNNTSSSNQKSSSLDLGKWLLAVGGLLGAILAFYWFDQESVLLRSVGLTLSVVLALALLYTTKEGQGAVRLFSESRREVRRVVWPTRSETTQTTILVLVFTLIVGIILFLLDLMLNWLFGLFIVT